VGSDVIGADPKLKPYPHDLKEGKGTIRSSGLWPRLRCAPLLFCRHVCKDREVCQVVAAQMVKGGFRVEPISLEYALHWGNELDAW